VERVRIVATDGSMLNEQQDDLTAVQRQAVEFFEGPLLVLAGPGSGKTRVITRRIARLVDRGVDPRSILAITFTNRAAREMQERVDSLLPGTRVWVSTFHRFCANVLRRRGRHVGLESNFVIFDKSDQLQVVRHVLQELDLDVTRTPAARVGARISRIKNALSDTGQFVESIDESPLGEPLDALVARVLPRYQQLLLESNAVDFDDLLLHVVRLFAENPELRSEYDHRFRWLLVDEYQDTNTAQYELVRAMSLDHRNVCVTGDPDQSIYAWRGANIGNILNFERDYPDARLIRLEQNFRSTQLILRSADQLIGHNRMRRQKTLFSDSESGDPVRLLRFADGRSEADGIAQTIHQACMDDGLKWSDCAVFYRVNAMSRELELAFTRNRIPFQVAAGLAFYDRAEIRDLLAYLRAVDNPADRVAFLRIINRPARGIGSKTQTRLQQWADEQHVTLLEAARDADRITDLSATARTRLKVFARLIDGFTLADAGSVSDLLKKIVEKTGYERSLGGRDIEQATEKRSNIAELINAAVQYDERNPNEPSLTEFLETTALVSDGDQVDPDAGRVTLMTLHTAKGLEFPAVFVVGLEQGLIPHERSVRSHDPKQIEEERRLLFVGMTRAMRKLYLTTACVRSERGTPRTTIPSPFLSETTYELVDATASGADRTSGGRFEEKDRDHRKRLKEAMAAGDRPRLMTGAALLNGTLEEAEIPSIFEVGMQVRHPQYGVGRVTDLSGTDRRRMVTVEFPGPPFNQTFSLRHCPLQPVGIR